jgi:hypothetical protein
VLIKRRPNGFSESKYPPSLPAKALNTTTNKGAGKILVGSNDPITELFVPPIEDRRRQDHGGRKTEAEIDLDCAEPMRTSCACLRVGSAEYELNCQH